jgi:ribosome-associated protein
MNLEQQVKKIEELIKDKKAKDVIIFNVEKLTSAVSYFVLASATSTTQAKGVVDYVEEEMSKLKIEPIRKDTKNSVGWVVLDYCDIMVHIMTEEVRDFYKLEKVWSK